MSLKIEEETKDHSFPALLLEPGELAEIVKCDCCSPSAVGKIVQCHHTKDAIMLFEVGGTTIWPNLRRHARSTIMIRLMPDGALLRYTRRLCQD